MSSILIKLLLLLINLIICQSQDFKDVKLPNLPSLTEYDDYDESLPFEKDILVIPNRFPKDLNFFCYPRTDLIRDRMCYGQLDAFSLLCADDTPPIHIVPFCIAFKHSCSKLNYPSENYCSREKKQYRRYCKSMRLRNCENAYYDTSCSCEPYENHWRRYGFDTAVWCQKYELYCDEDKRREKATEIVPILKDAVRVHYRCFHMFNLVQVICNPFRKQFDWDRCMKFVLDCELISDFEEDDKDESGEISSNKMSTSTEIVVETNSGANKSSDGKEGFIGTAEEEKSAKKIAEEEKLLEELIKESEREEMHNTTTTTTTMTTPSATSMSNATNVFQPMMELDLKAFETNDTLLALLDSDKNIDKSTSNLEKSENVIKSSDVVIADDPKQTPTSSSSFQVPKAHAAAPQPPSASIASSRSILRKRLAMTSSVLRPTVGTSSNVGKALT
ncbi:unnamed protein product [Auanema sp. JU1783]|nr:unnamed protein product [Auanema sp. JU1783]